MQKEQLKKYLNNQPLIEAIKQKMEIEDTRKKLNAMHVVAEETGLSVTVIDEIKAKCDEYNEIREGYDVMLAAVWKLSWQSEEIIKRHIDCTDDEIDKLPEVIKNI